MTFVMLLDLSNINNSKNKMITFFSTAADKLSYFVSWLTIIIFDMFKYTTVTRARKINFFATKFNSKIK